MTASTKPDSSSAIAPETATSPAGLGARLARCRLLLSSSLNRLLNRVGYALVRIDGARSPTMFRHEQGIAYAYEHVLIPDTYAPWALDEAFLKVWNEAQHNTLVDIYRCYELYRMVQECAGIPGDVLEVGVWRGGTGAVLAGAAERWKREAGVWLCDTFSGVVKAGEHDPSYSGGEHADTSLEIVRELMSRLGLENVRILQGIFPEETGDALADRPIAFCHVDVDVYQSAADIVEWIYPRMQSGAVVVFDDYGFSSCKGITRLIHELRESGKWVCLHNLNKHAILIKR